MYFCVRIVAALEDLQGPSTAGKDTLQACYDDLQKGTAAMEEQICLFL